MCRVSHSMWLVVGVLLFMGSWANGVVFRSIDGSGNNIGNPTWGDAGSQLLRVAAPVYDDGQSIPRGGDPSSLPNARAISNAISAQRVSIPNANNASDWVWQWGQFLDHDLDLTPAASPAQPFHILVPDGDPDFTPGDTITLNRSVFDPSTGTSPGNPRQQINQITSYIDASNVYGSDATRAAALRAPDGKLNTSSSVHGDLLPFNTGGLPNEGGTGAGLFLAGDVRANEQVGLTATHTLFVREHNRLATDLKARLDGRDATLIAKRDAAIAEVGNGVNNEGDFIYESVRKVVGAQIQVITYQEFLPALLGPDALTVFDGYDDTVNAGISNAFATAAYRFGHSMLPSQILRTNNDGTQAAEGHIALRDTFFKPEEIINHGIASLLQGLATGQAQEVDTLIVDDLRNFLFGPPGAGGLDMAALDIQRGRDHGLGDLNTVRSQLGLVPYIDFLDLTGGDAALAAAFASVYGDISEVDIWIGGLAEVHVNGGLLGDTFQWIIVDQFTRLRDGDRFFYLNDLDHLIAFDPDIENTRLSGIIRRNTGIDHIQDNVFFVAQNDVTRGVPEPVTVTLGLMGLGVLGMATRRGVA